MRNSLIIKLALCYFLVMSSMLLIINTYGYNKLKEYYTEQTIDSLSQKAASITKHYVPSLDSTGNMTDDSQEILQSLAEMLDIRIWAVSKNGTIVYDTKLNNSTVGKSLTQYNEQFLNEPFYVDHTMKGFLNKPVISLVSPFTEFPPAKGYLILHSPIADIEENARETVNTLVYCLLAFCLLLFLVFCYIAWTIVHPLRQIIEASREYASGNFDYPLKITVGNECRELAASITYMVGEINQFEEYQQKFVSNISHDFRSPLTSIKGYANAIKDGTIPPEMQDKYIDIILFESERLTKLTSNLLELNQLKSGSLLLDISSFDINSLIKQIVENLESSLMKKNLHLNLNFCEQEVSVDADQEKIQQVLYNLLENAIKFSGTDSSIDITIEERNDKIFVSVKDYGEGIAKENLGHIWDRFYKTDTSRGRDKKGTGLGLSIAREIITAHKENINVTSTEGVGSEFTFTLKKS